MKKNLLFLVLILMHAATFPCMGQAIVKYRIFCKDVSKISISTKKTISKYDKDILSVNVYRNRVEITSEKFDWTFIFSNGSHSTQKELLNIEGNTKSNGRIEVFTKGRCSGLGYIRNNKNDKGIRILPLLQVIFPNGYYYNFNVNDGEIFDNKRKMWIKGKALEVSDYKDDKIWQRLRKDMGKFCNNMVEYDLSERLNLGGDDPWKQ